MPSYVQELLHPAFPIWRAAGVVLVSIVVALLVKVVGVRLLLRLASKTKTTVDDQLVKALGKPVFVSVLLVGLGYAVNDVGLGETTEFICMGFLRTAAVLVWAEGAMRVGNTLLGWLSGASSRLQIVQESTLPMFRILLKVSVIGGGMYFAFLAWNVDVTGWLASAGIVGIAVGFAAKDTLANLFAGVFILTDAPYKVGDFIILTGGHRGLVTNIGMRSTRILTRDDVEVTIPNATIGNAQIVNESSGRHEKMRIRITVEVAYGSDVDEVRALLLRCAAGVEHVCDTPTPSVRFREFGSSGLVFQLRAWVLEPVYKGRVVDALNTKVYKALTATGVEIPYPKRDLYIKELPSRDAEAAGQLS